MPTAVTAIIPCMTNGDRPFIREAVVSVRAQTEPCDIIVAVEKSNDWIDDVLGGISGVQVIRIPMSPPGITRNAAINEAKTEFVAFLDADDAWLPTKIERQLRYVREHNADFVGVDHILMREDGTVFAYGTAKYVPMPSAWLVRRDNMLKFPFGPEGRGSAHTEDGTWWHNQRNPIVKHRLAESLLLYRVRNVSQSTARNVKERKLRYANLSRKPFVRPFLLAGTWFVHLLNRRTYYLRSELQSSS